MLRKMASWIRPSWKKPSIPPCACWITLSTITITACRRHGVPTCATARSAWASWDSRMPCINCAFPTAPKMLSVLPIAAWKRSVTMPSRRPPTWRKNAAPMLLTRVHCGVKVSCRSTPCRSWQKTARNTCRPISARHWTGTPCAIVSGPSACVTPTAWRLHRRQPFPISAVFANPLNQPTRTCS